MLISKALLIFSIVSLFSWAVDRVHLWLRIVGLPVLVELVARRPRAALRRLSVSQSKAPLHCGRQMTALADRGIGELRRPEGYLELTEGLYCARCSECRLCLGHLKWGPRTPLNYFFFTQIQASTHKYKWRSQCNPRSQAPQPHLHNRIRRSRFQFLIKDVDYSVFDDELIA